MKGRFVSYLIATCALIAAWFAQFFVVFPVESAIRGDGSGVITYSYLFLPHGIKVLVALLFMASGLPIIFGVQLLAGVYFGNDLPYAVWGALLALTAFADKSGEASGFTFARYCDLVGNDNAVSRAQFFKSLDVLLVSRAIEKTGSPRPATYVLAS